VRFFLRSYNIAPHGLFLLQFGTPDEVAQRVVDAEQNRDGVTDVALYGTPFEDPVTGSYGIDYISKG